MSYGYPGQGYGSAPPYGGGYGQQPPPPQGYQHGQYSQPPQGYGQYPPPHQEYGHPPPQQPHLQRPSGNRGGMDYYGRPSHQSGSRAPPAPSGAQQFGNGAPPGFTFQYSNCTGKRKALLIGINYFGQKGELRGCINDVRNLSEFLESNYGYRPGDMVKLTDDSPNPMEQPTKANILRAMDWLVRDAQPNDSLFLHFSGHGGQTKDLDGDEDDGYDEVIYPVDFKTEGHIVDDEINQRVVQPLQAGVRLTAIFDSCHSGSALDLPYIYSTKGVLKEPNMFKDAGEGALEAVTHYARGDAMSAVGSLFKAAKNAMRGDQAFARSKETRMSHADVISWSGSKDDQTSADATIASQATGAMSHAFVTALRKNPNQSYLELLNSIRDILEEQYTQKPQLSCSHPLDVNLRFVM